MATEALCSALGDRFALAIVVVTGERQIIDGNSAWRRLLATGDIFRAPRGRLEVVENQNGAILDDVVGRTSVAKELTWFRLRQARDVAILGCATALGLAEAQDGAQNGSDRVALFLARNRRGSLSDRMLRQLYDLSPAEARVAVKLADGCSITRIAQELNVSAHTIRSQVKSILQKTGAARQSDFVALVRSGLSLIIDES